MISVTLRFDYPGFSDIKDENEVQKLLSEMSADEILVNAMNAGEAVNMDVEVY